MSAVLREIDEQHPHDVDAVLNYTRDTGTRPVSYTFDPPAGVPRYSGEVDPRTVRILDARAVSGLTLDAIGFELLRHSGTLTDWASFQDPERVKAVDYPEAQAAIRAHTGADKVVIFDHTLRDSSATSAGAALREPVRRVHDDQTLLSAPKCGETPAARRSRMAARAPVCDHQFLAAGRRLRPARAAGRVRCAQHRRRRSHCERSGLSRLGR